MVELAQAVVWHRQVAALAAAADRVGVGEQGLVMVRARLLAQQARFAEAAARTAVTLAPLTPTPTEISAAAPALGDLSAAAVAESLRTSNSTLDAIDSVLADHLSPAGSPTPPRPVPTTPAPAVPVPVGPAPPGALPLGPAPPGLMAGRPSGVTGWRPGPRNALVYGGYASVVLAFQVFLLVVADEQVALPLLAPICLIVLPAFAWAAGWFTVAVAFRTPPGGPAVKRTPRLGAVVCLLPNLLLCAGLGVLFIVHQTS